MIEDRKYNLVGEVRHNLLNRLGRKQYFFDVQNRKQDGLVVLLHQHFNGDFVQRVIHCNRSGLKITYHSLVFVDQYLHWFCNWDNSKHSASFLQARVDARKSLEEKIGRSKTLYAGLKVMEQGVSRTVIDFAYKKEGILYLCKIAVSDKKDARKEKSLKTAARFFIRRFGRDLRQVESYIACLLPGKSPYFVLKNKQPIGKYYRR